MNEPIRLAVGPVLHADDTVANKVCALFGRAEIRDYVDVAAILASGRYSDDDLVRLAAAHDPGFDLAWFTEALQAVDRIPDTGFAEYGLDPASAAALRSRMHGRRLCWPSPGVARIPGSPLTCGSTRARCASGGAGSRSCAWPG